MIVRHFDTLSCCLVSVSGHPAAYVDLYSTWFWPKMSTVSHVQNISKRMPHAHDASFMHINATLAYIICSTMWYYKLKPFPSQCFGKTLCFAGKDNPSIILRHAHIHAKGQCFGISGFSRQRAVNLISWPLGPETDLNTTKLWVLNQKTLRVFTQ